MKQQEYLLMTKKERRIITLNKHIDKINKEIIKLKNEVNNIEITAWKRRREEVLESGESEEIIKKHLENIDKWIKTYESRLK